MPKETKDYTSSDPTRSLDPLKKTEVKLNIKDKKKLKDLLKGVK